MAKTPFSWISQFLKDRGLRQPDGRPLYAYQVSGEEHESLIHLLHNAALLASTGDLPIYDQCFVLFAAEWWRKNYDGHGWSWEPFFEALRVSRPPNQLIWKFVEGGLRKWKRPLRSGEGNHRQFLGSIVLEAGLPLRILLEDAGGESVRNFLQRIVRFLLVRNLHDEKPAFEFARYNQEALPKSLQHEEYLELLASMAAVTAQTIIQHELARRDDPVVWLDYKDPGWKECFPIALDSATAKDFLSQFLKAASKQEVRREGFRIERWLTHAGGSHELNAGLDMEGEHVSDDLLREIAGSSLRDSRLNAVISTDREQRLVATLLRKRDGYLIRKHDGGVLKADEACADIVTQLTGSGGQRYTLSIHGSDAPAQDLPWIFLPVGQKDGVEASRLYGVGATSCKERECIIALPDGWDMNAAEGAEIATLGSLSIQNRNLYRLQGRAVLQDARTGATCTVQTGAERAHHQFHELEGKRLPWRSSPPAYRGPVRIMVIEEGRLPHPVPNDEIRWKRPLTGAQWNESPLPDEGIVDLAVQQGGETRFRKRIALLPENFGIAFHTREGGDGEIRFRGIGGLDVEADRPLWCEKSGGDVRLHVPGTAIDAAEGMMTCFLRHPADSSGLRLHLPAPVRKAWIYRNGKPLPEGAPVYLANLHGLRIRTVLPRKGKIRVQLRLVTGDRNGFDRAFDFGFDFGEEDSQVQELNVFDLHDAILQLCALSDHIDDVVELFLRDEDENPLMRSPLPVRQFQANLTVCLPHIRIGQDDLHRFSDEMLHDTSLLAAPIWNPERKPLELAPEIREGAHTGAWILPSAVLRMPGPWLVFPGRNSKASLRPQLVIIQGDPPEPTCGLARAALISDKSERACAYDGIMEQLAKTPKPLEWQFIRLSLKRFGHLPLASHDLFRRLARNPQLMASLALDDETEESADLRENLLVRFRNEFPFLWENIPLSAWRMALGYFLRKLRETYNNHEAIVELLTTETLGGLLNDQILTEGALLVLAYEGAPAMTGQIIQNLQLDQRLLATAGNPAMLARHLMDDASPVQTLLHSAANANWPQWKETPLHTLLAPVFQSVVEKLRNRYFPVGYGYRKDIFLLPAVLAGSWLGTNSYPGDVHDPALVHAIRQFRDFCPQWFTQARDLFIVYGARMGAAS